jgi:hypothetical protein
MNMKQTLRTRMLETCTGVSVGYKPRTNMVKDEMGDLCADSYIILNRWRNHFSKFVNVHGVRQAEIHNRATSA